MRICIVLVCVLALGCRTAAPPIQVIVKPKIRFTHQMGDNTKLEVEL